MIATKDDYRRYLAADLASHGLSGWRLGDGVRNPELRFQRLLRRLEYPSTARAGAMIPVSMWWLNAGVAPVYGDYWLALRIDQTVVRVPVDVRKWLPGDAVFDGTLFVPEGISPGTHPLQVALLSARTGQPAIQLAIEGRRPDGWYDMGNIEIAAAK